MTYKPKGREPAWTAAQHIAKRLPQAIEVGECLEWQGVFSCKGVTPVVKVRTPGASYSDNVAVCRELWEAAYGPVPEGMLVYRTCCNNACVHLYHLTIGTRKQWHRHRKAAGMSKHKTATKLLMTAAARRRPTVVNTLEKAREVRALQGQMLQRDIARVTGVSPAMVSEICTGVCWKETIASPFAGLFMVPPRG